MLKTLPELPPSDPFLYRTQNLYEASYIICRGIRLAGKETKGNKATILFDGKDAQTAGLKFYNGGKVEAKAYSEAYRSLKDFVFQR